MTSFLGWVMSIYLLLTHFTHFSFLKFAGSHVISGLPSEAIFLLSDKDCFKTRVKQRQRFDELQKRIKGFVAPLLEHQTDFGDISDEVQKTFFEEV